MFFSGKKFFPHVTQVLGVLSLQIWELELRKFVIIDTKITKLTLIRVITQSECPERILGSST